MNKINQIFLIIVLIIVCISLKTIVAQDTNPTVQPIIQISKENREIKIEGNFNITSGILEFIAATNKTPRDYESLFLLDAKPSQIQTALMDIGLNPCYEKKENCNHLEITVTWVSGKEKITRNILEFIELNQTDKTFKDLQWVFTGREAIKDAKDNAIADDKNGETIALQPGIAGIIHPSIDFGNPYDENKQKGFRINEKIFKDLMTSNLLPKAELIKQTKITMTIKPKETKKEK